MLRKIEEIFEYEGGVAVFDAILVDNEKTNDPFIIRGRRKDLGF